MDKVYMNIRNRRIELGLTQDELAKKVGYKDRSMITKIEKGLVDLPIEKVNVFATVLGVTASWLMGWEDKLIEDGYTDETAILVGAIRKNPDLQTLILNYLSLDSNQQASIRNLIENMKPNR